jgi:hypothetical protein
MPQLSQEVDQQCAKCGGLLERSQMAGLRDDDVPGIT